MEQLPEKYFPILSRSLPESFLNGSCYDTFWILFERIHRVQT